ncbi:hypothetical protein [Streptomyces sp. NBC_01727]|uniref:hypothetical protein n=1 Tax=Streptomyces sp. NBC_01727 TaxID=2975924 RepID=UPI002E1529EA|nr:hypothetical protein OIE76_43855 [Streptomyces sp. NBC_01727]WSG86876.1 hypothetical protein OIE76_43910 [Streptomyces sp. NBC_01727]
MTQHTACSSSWTQTEVGNGVALSTELGQFGADDRNPATRAGSTGPATLSDRPGPAPIEAAQGTLKA